MSMVMDCDLFLYTCLCVIWSNKLTLILITRKSIFYKLKKSGQIRWDLHLICQDGHILVHYTWIWVLSSMANGNCSGSSIFIWLVRTDGKDREEIDRWVVIYSNLIQWFKCHVPSMGGPTWSIMWLANHIYIHRHRGVAHCQTLSLVKLNIKCNKLGGMKCCISNKIQSNPK